MSSSHSGKEPKKFNEMNEASSIHKILQFLQTATAVVETVKNDRKNLMKNLDNIKRIISGQRYLRNESEILKIMNNLKLELKGVIDRMDLEVEKDFSEAITLI